MIADFADEETFDVFEGRPSRSLLEHVEILARNYMDLLDAAHTIADIGSRPDADLTLDENGLHSIRLNNRFRLRFRWNPNVSAAHAVEIVKTAI